uniref:hypothetical protein n=1 Tax=Flavobacterium sp. TaxID=239 RepID=UPI00404AE841
MNITIKSKRKKGELVEYLIKSQKELVKECHEDYKTEKIKEVIERLKAKNESLIFNLIK